MGELYITTQNGETTKFCDLKDAEIGIDLSTQEDKTEYIGKIMRAREEITFSFSKAIIKTRALLVIFGIPMENNYRKMHCGIMTRERALKKRKEWITSMNRLTYRIGEDVLFRNVKNQYGDNVSICYICDRYKKCTRYKDRDSCTAMKAVRKLAQYEDSGLNPEQVINNSAKLDRAHKIIEGMQIQYIDERNLPYESKGLALYMPCNIGDNVYIIEDERITTYKATGFMLGRLMDDNDIKPSNVFRMECENGYVKTSVLFTEIGKTVFFTKQEASEKLEEEQDEIRKILLNGKC